MDSKPSSEAVLTGFHDIQLNELNTNEKSDDIASDDETLIQYIKLYFK